MFSRDKFFFKWNSSELVDVNVQIKAMKSQVWLTLLCWGILNDQIPFLSKHTVFLHLSGKDTHPNKCV